MKNELKMPGMPELKTSSDAVEINSSASSSSPLADDSAPVESEVSLGVPSHEEKPKIASYDDNNSSNAVVPLVPKKGIEVVAMSAGFYNQKRILEGESFFIPSMEKIGAWMRCVDPVYEKQKIEFYKLKKAKKADK